MARVLKGSHSFTCTPNVHPLAEWTIPTIAFPAEAGTHLLTPEGWKAELALVRVRVRIAYLQNRVVLIYIQYFHSKISDIFNFYQVFNFLKNVTHCDYVLIFSVCVLLAYDLCPQSIFSVLDNICQIAPLHSNAVWMTRVLHLICKVHTYTHILLFGSEFHNIENIGYFQYFRKYHDIFQTWFRIADLRNSRPESSYHRFYD